MKPFRKITILFFLVAGIVVFWLMPGINKATDVRYTRLYEDTDVKTIPSDTINRKRRTTTLKVLPPTVVPRVYYKRESINSSAKLKHIKPSMFSRGMQFIPEKEIILIDTLSDKDMDDSLMTIQ